MICSKSTRILYIKRIHQVSVIRFSYRLSARVRFFYVRKKELKMILQKLR